jgi:hypothetical protein
MENSGNSPKLFWRKLVRVQEFWKIQIILNKKKIHKYTSNLLPGWKRNKLQ